MSRYSKSLGDISPYVPGEQPRDRRYIKLNTNENPYEMADGVADAVTRGFIKGLSRYSDPDAADATHALAETLGLPDECVVLTNGSDEAIAFSFLAFARDGIVTPDITYTFYKKIAALFGIDVREIPLDDDFRVQDALFRNCGRCVVLANPNAQTGIALEDGKIEEIIKRNAGNAVIIDGAYADFSDCRALPLTEKYGNLLYIGTFSKSRSLAGARIGYAAGNRELIDDIRKVKYSFNPYNVNALSQCLAVSSLADEKSFKENIRLVRMSRAKLTDELRGMGFFVLPSQANFVTAKTQSMSGRDLYMRLRDRGILVRHFPENRINEFIRITVGTESENAALVSAIEEILEGTK